MSPRLLFSSSAVVLLLVLGLAAPHVITATMRIQRHLQNGELSFVDAVEPAAVTLEEGGAVKRVYINTNDEPFVVGETAEFVAVPGMSRTFSWSTGGSDLVVVTFSAEAQLRFTTDNFDWIEIEVRLDGVPMAPHDAGSPTAFHGAYSYTLASGQWARRVPLGSHTVEVFVKVVDNVTDNSLSAWIDDMTLKIERFN